MLTMVLTFLIVFGMIFLGIRTITSMPGNQLWSLTKILSYSTLCAVLTTLALVFFVLVF